MSTFIMSTALLHVLCIRCTGGSVGGGSVLHEAWGSEWEGTG